MPTRKKTHNPRCEYVRSCNYPATARIIYGGREIDVCSHHAVRGAGRSGPETHPDTGRGAKAMFENLFKEAPPLQRKILTARLNAPQDSIREIADSIGMAKSTVATTEQRFRRSGKYQRLSSQWNKLVSKSNDRASKEDLAFQSKQGVTAELMQDLGGNYQVSRRTRHGGGPDRGHTSPSHLDYDGDDR